MNAFSPIRFALAATAVSLLFSACTSAPPASRAAVDATTPAQQIGRAHV